MTSPNAPEAGQNINLAALWIPVLPDTSKIADEMRKSGSEAKKAFEEGFNASGQGSDALTNTYVQYARKAMETGFANLEIPFGVSKLHDWLDQFNGEVDEKVVKKLKGDATQALRNYAQEHDGVVAAQDRLTNATNKLNLARDNGFNKASIIVPLLAEETKARSALEAQTTKEAAAHDKLSAVHSKLADEEAKAATGGQFLAGVMGGTVVLGAGLAIKGIEKFLELIKDGFEAGIEITKELGRQTIELGERYEGLGIGLREFSAASGEEFEGLEKRAQKVFSTLDVAGEDTGKMFGQLTSVMGETIPNSLVKHIEELRGRFAGLKADDLASIFYDFKVPAEETDNVLASLAISARESGHGLDELVGALKGNASEVLHEAGLNAQQAGAFIGEMLKLGSGGRSVLGGLQTVMKEAAKEGMSFGDGMKYAGQHLKDLGDTAEGQGYAEKLFGTRRWAVAMQAVQNYVDIVDKAPDAFNRNSDSLDQFLTDTEKLENKWEEVKHKIEEALMPLGMGALDLVGNLISTIKDKFQANLPAIKATVKSLGDSFIDNLPQVQNFVVGAIEMLGPLADFVKAMGVVFTGIFVGAGQIWATVTGDDDLLKKMNAFNDSLNKIKGIDFSDMADKVATQIGGIDLKTDDLKKSYDKLWDSARGEGEGQHSPGETPPDPSAGWGLGRYDQPVNPAAVPQPGTPIGDLFAKSAAAQPGQSGIYQDSTGKWHAHDPWWEGVMQAESGGNIAPTTNPNHFGLFQFSQETWDSIARQQNPAWVGKNPGTAPAEVQAQMAQQNYNQNKSNLPGQWANPFVAAHPAGTTGTVWASNGNGPGDAPDPSVAGQGINLSTVAVAAQKYANDCIDASARIILSHSGVNMDEDQLEKVIAPGTNIDSLATGLNQLDPQGGFRSMPGSGGSQEAMFAAIKASIDSGTGSIANVAPGSSIAGRPFSEGHFIAVTGYNNDGTINLSDTAGGKKYTVSAADLYQATSGRGIVAGTGTGPSPESGPGGEIGPSYDVGGRGSIPGGGKGGRAGLAYQYGGLGVYGGETADQKYAADKAVREANDRAADMDAEIARQNRTIQDIKDEIAKGDPKNKPGLLGQSAETPEEAAAWAEKQKRLNEQLADATTSLAKTQRERSEQDGEIAQAQRKQQEAMLKNPKGTGQSGEGKAGETLGQGLLAGISQELGLGDVFGKSPMDWGIVKLAEGLFNYGNNLGDAVFGKSGGFGTPGGSQGLGGGIFQGVAQSLGIKMPNISTAPNVVPPMPSGNDHLGPGGPTSPGPMIVNNDNSVTVSSDVSDRAVMAPVQAYQNSSNSAAYQYQGGMPAQ